MLGALGAARERRHLSLDLLPRLLPPLGRRIVWAFAQLLAAGLCAAMAWYGWSLVELEREAPGPLFAGLPSWAGMLIIPFGFAVLALRLAIASVLGPPPEQGAGEAGAVGSPPAVINALVDALAGDGVSHIDMPATPETIWKAIAGAKRAA